MFEFLLSQTKLFLACLIFLAASLSASAQTVPVANSGKRDKAFEYLKLAHSIMPKKGDDLLEMASEDMIEAFAKAGDYDEAIKTAQVLPYRTSRIQSLVQIIEIQVDAGDMQGAKTTLNLAEVEAENDIKHAPGSRDGLDQAAAIGRAQALVGDLAGGDQTQAQMPESAQKALVLASIGFAKSRKGDVPGSEHAFAAAVDALRRSPAKSSAYVAFRIASIQVRSRSQPTALNILRTGTDKAFQIQAYLGISIEMAEAGDKAGAKKILAEARADYGKASGSDLNPVARVRLLRQTGLAAFSSGDFAGAKELLQQAEKMSSSLPNDSVDSSVALARVAIAQAHAGDHAAYHRVMSESLEKLAELPTKDAKTRAMWLIAQTEADANHGAAASDLVLKAMDPPATNPTTIFAIELSCEDIAEGICRSDGPGADLAWINKLSTPEQKTFAYIGAAKGLLGKGTPEK